MYRPAFITLDSSLRHMLALLRIKFQMVSGGASSAVDDDKSIRCRVT